MEEDYIAEDELLKAVEGQENEVQDEEYKEDE